MGLKKQGGLVTRTASGSAAVSHAPRLPSWPFSSSGMRWAPPLPLPLALDSDPFSPADMAPRSLLLLLLLLASPFLLRSSADDDLDYIIDNADDIPSNDPDGWLHEGSPDDDEDDDLLFADNRQGEIDETHVFLLTASNFSDFLASRRHVMVEFYAPWCGHCKRLVPQLDEAAPVLAGLTNPIVVAKVDADKYKKLGSKYGVDGFPTLMLFDHGVPTEYTGSRKADLLIENLKKLFAPHVSVLESDSAIKRFVQDAGVGFPLFIGFGVDESLIAEYGAKYKKKAWFSAAKDFSEDMMSVYDFDKVPALVSLNPKYNEQSVFYGPFEGTFLEDFIQQSLLPLTLPINAETVKMLKDDDRNVVLTILEDEFDENSMQLIKVLRSAANANHDLVFGYVGVKQWEEFIEPFHDSKSSQLPKMVVWDGDEEYEVVEGSESLKQGDHGSQISRFLEGYRAGRTTKKKVGDRSLTLLGVNASYILIFLVAILVVLMYFSGQGEEDHQPVRPHQE